MAATGVVCYIFLITLVVISEGTICRPGSYVELSANSQSRYIYSPNYPEPFPAYTYCKWRIRIESQSRSKVIQVRTVDVDLPKENNNCSKSYISAYDGQHNTAPLIKRWCDSSTIVSTGAYIIIEFHSDHLPSKGFALAYHELEKFSHECVPGGVQKIDITQTPLIVSLPTKGVFSDGNENCEWLFTANKMNSKIIAEIDDWIIPSTSDFCNNTFIEFFDGDDSNSSLPILRYCHQDRPFHHLTTSSDKLLVRLHSSSQNTTTTTTKLPVIKLKIHSVKINYPSCHSMLQTDTLGSLPNYLVYPSGDSTMDACPLKFWSSDKGSSIRVDIVNNTDYNVTCTNYLHVYNDSDATDVLEHICIDGQPSYINKRHVMVKDIINGTDKVVLRAHTVDFGCDGNVIEHWAENDVKKPLAIGSPHGVYDNYGYCRHLLRAEKADERIKVFVSGSLFEWDQGDYDCDKDYIALYDGSDENSSMITKWCGGSVPDGFHSTGRDMLVIFRSDQHGRQHDKQYDIEYIAYKEMCSKYSITLNATSSPQNLSSPGFPDYYPPESLCRWVIKPTSEDHYIVFKSLLTSLDPECHSMISTFEYDGDNQKVIGRVCEKETPTLMTQRGLMEVEFRSNGRWNVGGFIAEYWEEPKPTPAPVYSSSKTIESYSKLCCYLFVFIMSALIRHE